MTKNPLLPKEYSDSATQSAIMYALSAYKVPADRIDIVNPALKWNLTKAWEDAKELLARRNWKRMGGGSDTMETGYEMTAYTDKEIDELNIVIAGIVARHITDPESGVALRRVEHRRGGEMALAVSEQVVETLRQLVPALSEAGQARGGWKTWQKLLKFAWWRKDGSNG